MPNKTDGDALRRRHGVGGGIADMEARGQAGRSRILTLAISAHRLPRTWWDSRMVRSSRSVQGALLMCGLRWLCHRSRHCFPMRPGRCDAMSDQRFAPYLLTRLRTVASSCWGAAAPGDWGRREAPGEGKWGPPKYGYGARRTGGAEVVG